MNSGHFISLIAPLAMVVGCATSGPPSTQELPAAPIVSDSAPPLGPYSSAVCANGVLYVSGVIGFDYASQRLAGADFDAQANAAFDNLFHVLRDSDSSPDRLYKVTAFLKSPEDISKFNAVYVERMAESRPARTIAPGVDFGGSGAMIELDAIGGC
jgi:2-iminobutanoate/2-iminopropanoate deaminase